MVPGAGGLLAQKSFKSDRDLKKARSEVVSEPDTAITIFVGNKNDDFFDEEETSLLDLGRNSKPKLRQTHDAPT